MGGKQHKALSDVHLERDEEDGPSINARHRLILEQDHGIGGHIHAFNPSTFADEIKRIGAVRVRIYTYHTYDIRRPLRQLRYPTLVYFEV